MKFTAKTKGCQLVIKAKASFSETVDQKELDRFARVCLRGFLKPKLLKSDFVEYTGPVGVSLYDRLRKPMLKRDFLLVLEQIVVAVQKLHANGMGLNNMMMNPQYVYINEATKEVQFVYLPTLKGVPNFNLIQFIENITCSVKMTDDNDREFVSRFLRFIKVLKPFDISKVEAFIAAEDKSVVNTIKKQNAGQSGFMTNKQQHYFDHYEAKKTVVDEDATGLLPGDMADDATGLLVEEDEPTSLLIDDKDDATGLLYENEAATSLLINDVDQATGLLSDDSDDDDDDATGLLVGYDANVHYPTLFRVLTKETIYVNKPVFRLGKEKSYVDYFVANNVAVSRSHADIITRGNKCFIKDLNSKNHTFINGRELPVGVEVELCDGNSLKLGNEEFIFKL